MEMPERSIKDEIGDAAVELIKRRLPREWIVRDQSKDYGIDLEVELVEPVTRRVSGIVFKVQSRGHRPVKWTKGGNYLQPAERRHLNYWRVFAVPVVLMLVDVGPDEVFWAPGEEAEPGSCGIRVSRHTRIPDTLPQLINHILSRMDAREIRSVLYRLPALARRYAQRIEGVCQSDPWCHVEDDDLRETRDVYHEVMRLGRAVGLTVADALPWDFWLARSKKAWGDGELMMSGTHDELMLYLKSFYDPAFQKACQIVAAEEVTPDNTDVKSFVEHAVSGRYETWAFQSPFDDLTDAEWSPFERQLKDRGALRMSFLERAR